MSTPTQVTLHKHGVTIDAIKANDHDTIEAVAYARRLHDEGATFDLALIDRFDGLLLVGASGNYHFTTPICGYMGNGPTASARILELFEFGSKDTILEEICHGDNDAKFRLYR